jgi:hypothetical protein
MLRYGFCGYYAIISQGNSITYSGDTLGVYRKNQEKKNDELEIANDLKERIVIPYLQSLNINWMQNCGESFQHFLTGLLPVEEI